MKIKLFKNGAYATFEKTLHGYYLVTCRGANGYLLDRIKCDDYANARAYYKSFAAIARQS